MSETLEQIALRIWNEEYPYSKTPEFPIEFAKRLVEALGAQEPVAWMFKGITGTYFGTADKLDRPEAVDLYAAPKPGEVK